MQKRSHPGAAFVVQPCKRLWINLQLNSNYTITSSASFFPRPCWTSLNWSGWRRSLLRPGKARRTSCIPGQKTDLAHPPPQMAYTRGEKLHGWYKTVNRCTIREVKSARDANRSREDNVLNYFIARSTNASAESLNSKMKAFRAQLRGVSDLPFFVFRLCRLFG